VDHLPARLVEPLNHFQKLAHLFPSRIAKFEVLSSELGVKGDKGLFLT
jgi:hypothetical protein